MYNVSIRGLLFSALTVAGASLSLSSASMAIEVASSHTVRAGGTIQVGRHSSVWNDCTILPGYGYIIQQPSHGRILHRTGPNRINGGFDVSRNCYGRTGRGLLVYYKSDSGFRGVDRFSYVVRFPGYGKEALFNNNTFLRFADRAVSHGYIRTVTITSGKPAWRARHGKPSSRG